MNVRELIKELQELKDELKDKEVCVEAKNGALLPIRITFVLKDESKWELTKENVEKIVFVG